MIRTVGLTLVVAILIGVPPVHGQQALGPAAVVRPIRGESPLPPEPPEPTGSLAPATATSPTEPLEPLPTEAELRARAQQEAEARRPAPLQPRAIPQRVESLGQGRFLILPQEAPLTNNGTLTGYMFNDETELLAPLPAPNTVSQPLAAEPTLEEDFNTVRNELQAIRSEMSDIVSQVAVAITSPTTVPVAPQVAKPEVAQPAPPKVEAVKPPPAKLPAPLTLTYHADRNQAENAAAIKRWAAKLPQGKKVNLQVTSHTQTPPLGTTIADLATSRWNTVRTTLASQRITLGKVSFIHLKGAEQRLVLKALR